MFMFWEMWWLQSSSSCGFNFECQSPKLQATVGLPLGNGTWSVRQFRYAVVRAQLLQFGPERVLLQDRIPRPTHREQLPALLHRPSRPSGSDGSGHTSGTHVGTSAYLGAEKLEASNGFS